MGVQGLLFTSQFRCSVSVFVTSRKSCRLYFITRICLSKNNIIICSLSCHPTGTGETCTTERVTRDLGSCNVQRPGNSHEPRVVRCVKRGLRRVVRGRVEDTKWVQFSGGKVLRPSCDFRGPDS